MKVKILKECIDGATGKKLNPGHVMDLPMIEQNLQSKGEEQLRLRKQSHNLKKKQKRQINKWILKY